MINKRLKRRAANIESEVVSRVTIVSSITPLNTRNNTEINAGDREKRNRSLMETFLVL